MYFLELFIPNGEYIFIPIGILLVTIFVYPSTYPYRETKIVQKCDPQRFLAETDELFYNSITPNHFHNFLCKNDLIGLTITRSAALCDCGFYNEALDVIKMLEISNAHINAMQKSLIYHNLAFVCAMNNDIYNSYKYYELEMSNMKNSKFLTSLYKSNIVSIYSTSPDLTRAFILLKSGELERAEEIYTHMFSLTDKSKSLPMESKVGLSYEVGTLKYELGKYDEAITYLQFVAQNGGTMIYVTQSQELLSRIYQNNMQN